MGDDSAGSGRIYVTYSMISTSRVGQRRVLKRFACLDRRVDLAARFKAAYERTWRFLFNPFLSNGLQATYLGSRTIDPADHAFDRLGRIRCDYVLVQNAFFGNTTIDMHYLIEHNVVDLRDAMDDRVAQLIGLINTTYNLQAPDWPPMARDVEDALRTKDELSRYIYVSLCDQPKEVVVDWRRYAEPIYRFLVGQARGTSSELARDYLDGRHWYSTDFYYNFYQPGATLSLSCRYPDLYAEHIGYFLPTIDSIDLAGPCLLGKDEDGADALYDRLPEYPPLRYLGQPMLAHAGWVEAGMRDAQSRLLRIYDSRPPIRQILAAWRASHLQASYYRLRMLDALRLPVSRRYSRTLIAEKDLTPIAESVQQLQSGMINSLLIILAVLTIVLTIVTLLRG